MEPMPRMKTFVVRVSGHEPDELTGTVERVQTGEKHRFRGADALAGLIARLAAPEQVAGDVPERDRGSET